MDKPGSKRLKNRRHESFARHYTTEINGIMHNATQSAIKAGYSERTAGVTGNKLLKLSSISERIDFLTAIIFKKCELNAEYVITRLMRMADDDISNYLKFQMDVLGRIDMSVRDSDTIDTWNISEVSVGKDGQFKFKLHDKKDAVIKLGQHLGLFTDKLEIDGKLNAIVKIIEDI